MNEQRASSLDPSPAREALCPVLPGGPAESVEEKMARLRDVLAPTGTAGDDRARDALFRYVAEQMVRSGSPKTSPIVGVINHVGNYWRNWLLMILSTGAYRPSTICRVLAALDPARHISQRMLTINLRMLERDGLIARSVIDDKRLNVEYELTPLGADLSEQLLLLLEWSDRHASDIAAARAAFDDVYDAETD